MMQKQTDTGENFEYVLRRRGEKVPASLTLTGLEQAEKTSRFHCQLPSYAPTPLVLLDALAGRLGIGKLWVKDESKRFGLREALGLDERSRVLLISTEGDTDQANYRKILAEA
ncbi:MAG: hypothetical protein LUF30_00620 [Lachnospiraceae bacterium]|nr:hypothetical protein [Lachnospiraceae bacterium]